jgi:hypothetical protein
MRRHAAPVPYRGSAESRLSSSSIHRDGGRGDYRTGAPKRAHTEEQGQRLGRERVLFAVAFEPFDHPQQREIASEELRTRIFTASPLVDQLAKGSLVLDEFEAGVTCSRRKCRLELLAHPMLERHRHARHIARNAVQSNRF